MSAAATVTDVLAGTARWCVVEGDSADVLASIPSASVHALVTDPPAGIGFMGREWDKDKGGRAQWAAWLASVLGLARVAVRPGGRAFVWALPRTTHWTGCAVEDAGWAVETVVTHLFGTGWPKGASQLKPSSEHWYLARTGPSTGLNVDGCRVTYDRDPPDPAKNPLYRKMNGYANGRAPHKPGTLWGLEGKGERNPQSGGRWPPNTLFTHSPGCERVGERRVRGDARTGGGERPSGFGNVGAASGNGVPCAPGHADHADPELVEAWRCVEGCPVAELDAQSGDRPSTLTGRADPRTTHANPGKCDGRGYGGGVGGGVGQVYADAGPASRFFPQFPADDPDAPWSEAMFRYVAKPSRAERNVGLVEPGPRRKRNELLPGDCYGNDRSEGNTHPTVKSVALMRWLLRLVTKPGDVILDPFGGSGTTGVAALLEGRRVVLIEREPAFAAIARARCAAADGSDWTAPIVAPADAPREPTPRQLPLFAAGAR